MIITKLIGGLGNQMFQYAAGRALAARLGLQLCIDRRGFSNYKVHAYGLDKFGIQAEDVSIDDLPLVAREDFLWRGLRKLKLIKSPEYFSEKSFCFDPRFLALKDGAYLDGYWQSERYFADAAEIIRSDFKIKSVPTGVNLGWLERIKNTVSVSMHVRRGDYVTSVQANAVHGTCGVDYYQRAISVMHQRLGSELEFFLFSDDLAWAKEHLNFGGAPHHFVDANDASTNYEDLRLMSACRHHVIANSTFSWWGAWLNPRVDKVVVAPMVWFRDQTLNDTDLVPKSWLRI